MAFLALIAFLISVGSSAGALTGQQIAADLRPSLSSETGFFFPKDANYTSETVQRWNEYDAPSYAVSIKPTTAQDIQSIMKFAAQNQVPFLGTGGGHGYTTSMRVIQNGIQIDLGNFDAVTVDTNANTVTVGGGAHFGNVTGPLAAAGRELPVGADTCVGFTGATLGGGTGAYAGIHGLVLDSLLSVEMVTGTGDIVTASATQHPDLFWGIRGAGFNFGIVTSSTLKTYEPTNGGTALNADFIFPAAVNQSLWEYIAAFNTDMPTQLWISPGVAFNATSNSTFILFNLIYIGPTATAQQYLDPLLALHPTRHNITQVPYAALESSTRFALDSAACAKGHNHTIYSLNLYHIDPPTLTSVTNYMDATFRAQPALRSATLAFDRLPNAVINAVPTNSTAFPSRDALAYVHFDVEFADPLAVDAANAFGGRVRSMLATTSGRAALAVYVSYAHGDEGEAAWYGESLGRLREVKKRWDPRGLFSSYNAVRA